MTVGILTMVLDHGCRELQHQQPATLPHDGSHHTNQQLQKCRVRMHRSRILSLADARSCHALNSAAPSTRNTTPLAKAPPPEGSNLLSEGASGQIHNVGALSRPGDRCRVPLPLPDPLPVAHEASTNTTPGVICKGSCRQVMVAMQAYSANAERTRSDAAGENASKNAGLGLIPGTGLVLGCGPTMGKGSRAARWQDWAWA